jgi:hypothetical protein
LHFLGNSKSTMSNSKSSLIYIPDISGFTKFVTETEIDHSTHIIEELLEIIVDSNEINLEISEIEGDAILFYRFGAPPTVDEVVKQSKDMFIRFHEHLKLYERDRVCQCGACSTAQDLTLKMVAHYGELSEVKVRERSKLLGGDMIIAHRLLKNEVDNDEYLLLSLNYLNAVNSNLDLSDDGWVQFEKGKSSYGEIGDVEYNYVVLTPLHEQVKSAPPRVIPERTSNPVVLHGRINASIKWVYELLSNLDYKLKISGIEIRKDDSVIQKVGSSHVCILPVGTLHFETTQAELDADQMVFAESASNLPILGEATFIYVLDKIDSDSCSFKAEIHFRPKNILDKLKFSLFRIPLKLNLKKGMQRVKDYAEKNQPIDQNA